MAEEYRQLFKVIDETSISDWDKLNSKMKIFELAEKSKNRSETRNVIGKTIVATTVIVGSTIVVSKALKTYEKVTKAAATVTIVKNVCYVIINVVTLPFRFLR